MTKENHGPYEFLGSMVVNLMNADRTISYSFLEVQSPNQKIPDRKTKCVIETYLNTKQNVIFGLKLKPV